MQIIPRDQYVNRGLPIGQEKKLNKQAVSRPVSFDNQFSVIIKIRNEWNPMRKRLVRFKRHGGILIGSLCFTSRKDDNSSQWRKLLLYRQEKKDAFKQLHQ